MDKHNMYHYPKLTDMDKIRLEATKSSLIKPVTVHFHPYSDNGCEEGLKERSYKYAGLPLHERYVNGKLETFLS